ncbi:helix-turn-helix domain-containing protein, partial [Acinetobacter baumannii]|uniref:helix-turn-helix domain-containing protein n=1 Tax=Acinetobacter baumannii TaxID=470 RepID=UPI00196A06B1
MIRKKKKRENKHILPLREEQIFMENLNRFNPNRLKFARLYEGMTTSELANHIGVSKQMISQYENGKSAPS